MFARLPWPSRMRSRSELEKILRWLTSEGVTSAWVVFWKEEPRLAFKTKRVSGTFSLDYAARMGESTWETTTQ